MRYKIIALDVDGTLVRSDLKISPNTRDALIRVQRDYGMMVVLASGRPTLGLKGLAQELHLAQYGGYILPFNGGQMFRADNLNKAFAESCLSPECKVQLYALAQEAGLTILSYNDNEILTEHPEDPEVHKEMAFTSMPVRGVSNFIEDSPSHLPKCLIVGKPERIATLAPVARERFAGSVDAFISDPSFLELVPSGINKGTALAHLLKHLNLDFQNLIAVGDSYNDLEMIRLAGLGVAMGNARQAVKDVADYITESHDEDGIARLLERYIFV